MKCYIHGSETYFNGLKFITMMWSFEVTHLATFWNASRNCSARQISIYILITSQFCWPYYINCGHKCYFQTGCTHPSKPKSLFLRVLCTKYCMLVRFEVFTAVTMKNGVFWDVMPCGSCKNRRFGGAQRLLHQGYNKR
jgi:hypothetical protein